jgi:transcriptional regulator with GAF, ATPase, and Fis domain
MRNLDLFREVTLQVCGTLDLAQAFKNVFKLLKPLLPVDELRINILDTDLHAVKTILIVADKKTENLLFNPLVLPLPPDVENELKSNHLEDIRIVDKIEDDRATSAIKSDYFNDVPDSSMLIMRLLLDKQRQGALLLRAEGENRYTDKHKKLLAQLNEPLAIALNNALAHYKIEQLKNTLAEENRYLQN